MPQDTFFNLHEEKRDKVLQAIINEFTKVTLENASIKNIVQNAGIPRGSFYQYFIDKEDAMRYIIFNTCIQEEKNVTRDTNFEPGDLYDFILYIYNWEIRFLEKKTISIRMQLLKQISESPRATALFNEEITNAITQSAMFKKYWDISGLNHLTEKENITLMDLLITSLKETLINVLRDKNCITMAEEQLRLKLIIIKEGVRAVFKI